MRIGAVKNPYIYSIYIYLNLVLTSHLMSDYEPIIHGTSRAHTVQVIFVAYQYRFGHVPSVFHQLSQKDFFIKSSTLATKFVFFLLTCFREEISTLSSEIITYVNVSVFQSLSTSHEALFNPVAGKAADNGTGLGVSSVRCASNTM